MTDERDKWPTTEPWRTTTRNDAAERLRTYLSTIQRPPMPLLVTLDDALAAERKIGRAEGIAVARRATVERIRERFAEEPDGNMERQYVLDVLDEEAARWSG